MFATATLVPAAATVPLAVDASAIQTWRQMDIAFTRLGPPSVFRPEALGRRRRPRESAGEPGPTALQIRHRSARAAPRERCGPPLGVPRLACARDANNNYSFEFPHSGTW